MKDKIIYIILGALILNLVYNWIKTEPKIDYSIYQDEWNKGQEQIKKLDSTIKVYDNEIFKLKDAIEDIDSTYDGADKSFLRKKSNAYRRRYDLL